MNYSIAPRKFVFISFSLFFAGIFFAYFLPDKSVKAQVSEGSSFLSKMQEEVRKLTAEAIPGVVKIDVTEKTDGNKVISWDDFFKEGNDSKILQGLGSGFIIEKKAETIYVLTNLHVTDSAKEVKITLYNNKTYKGVVIGKEERLDLALIEAKVLSTDHVYALPLADSDKLFVGDLVFAIGAPFGFENSVTSGIVSAVGRRKGPNSNLSDFIQTDAAINQGNSGGILLDIYGQVVGINTWISTPTGGNIGLGFTLPINRSKRFYRSIIDEGSFDYAWLGIRVKNLNKNQLENLDINRSEAIYVSQVFYDSPAYRAGIKPGDIILNFNNIQIKDSKKITLLVGEVPIGDTIKVDLYRSGEILVKKATLELRNNLEVEVDSLTFLWPGMTFLEKNGLYIEHIIPGTSAQKTDFREGDKIVAINGKALSTLLGFYDLLQVISSKKERIIIEVERNTNLVKVELLTPEEY